MSTQQSVVRDERTVAIENASYKWAYILLLFALFIDMLYRGMVRHENAWDLMALVFVSSALCTMYQVRQKTLAHGWWKAAVLITCVGAAIGAIVVIVGAILVKTHAM